MYVKVFIFTTLFVAACYKLNAMMLYKLQKRHARNAGQLDEFLQEEEKQKEQGFIRRKFGKIGGGADEGIDGGIKNTSIGGAWELKTLDGHEFGSKNLAGRYYLIFFGSTLCPDVCPFTLRTLMKSIRILKQTSEGKQYIKPVPVFVSVNPKYDTAEKLKKFRDDLYGPELLILREKNVDAPNLKAILKQFKVPYGLNDQEKD